MSEWGVALVVVVVFAVVVVAVAVLVRLFGVYRLTSCLASDEERAALTKSDQPANNGGLVSPESSEFMLSSTSGKLAQYDTLTSTLTSDPKLPDLDPDHAVASGRHDDSARSSPVSVGTSSLASDLDCGHGIRRAESCDSVASDSSVLDLQPDMPKIGQVELALEFDKEVSELVVSVFQCKDLPPNPYTGTLDSFVKGILLPLSDDKFQTKTIKNTTDPVFKERFLFAVEPEQLYKRVLTLQVFSVDKYARQKVVGEADLRVGDVDLNMPIKIWLNLRDLDEKPTEYGDIFFSLSYLPTAERLTIVIVKARHLKWREGRDTGDPFVKVYLLQNGKKISKKKTTVKRGERNPIYNEAMIFSVPAQALPTIQLRITVADLLPENKTASLGHVIVGANTSGTEASHWNQMMTSLRKPTAMWHYLRK